jgi:excisionase family DNA binding protein
MTESATSRTVRNSAASPRSAGRGERRPTRPIDDEWLTVDEVCSELKIGRRTFERWRTLGTGPRAVRLAGNGQLRIRRSWLERWAEDGTA